MRMAEQSNPRKLFQSGNGTVVSLPEDIQQAAGVEQGDRVVLTAEEGQITMQPVEWEVASDE